MLSKIAKEERGVISNVGKKNIAIDTTNENGFKDEIAKLIVEIKKLNEAQAQIMEMQMKLLDSKEKSQEKNNEDSQQRSDEQVQRKKQLWKYFCSTAIRPVLYTFGVSILALSLAVTFSGAIPALFLVGVPLSIAGYNLVGHISKNREVYAMGTKKMFDGIKKSGQLALSKVKGLFKEKEKDSEIADELAQDELSQDELSQDELSQDELSQDELSQDELSQDELSQDELEQDELEQDSSDIWAELDEILNEVEEPVKKSTLSEVNKSDAKQKIEGIRVDNSLSLEQKRLAKSKIEKSDNKEIKVEDKQPENRRLTVKERAKAWDNKIAKMTL